MQIKEFALYETRDDVTVTAYLVHEKGELLGQGLRPGVIICPGGGYMNLADREAEPVALAFAAMGYHAFILRYSVLSGATKDDNSLSDSPQSVTEQGEIPHLEYMAPVREVGLTMLLLRKHADEWHLNMDQIAVCGFSAGAHNAAMYGVYWDKPLMTEYLHVDKSLLKPGALILGYGLSDYRLLMNSLEKLPPMMQGMRKRILSVLTGKMDHTDEDLKAFSPALLVSENTPPAFLWATSEDDLVPCQQSLAMAHALADHGIPFEVHIFENGPHGLSLASSASSIAKSQIYEDVSVWTHLAESWLKKRLKFDVPEFTEFEITLKERGLL